MAAGDLFQQRSDFLKKHMPKEQQLRTNPTTTTTTTTATGDLEHHDLVQIVSNSEVAASGTAGTSSFDYVRMKNMTAVGLMQGPFHHYFYAVLERLAPGTGTLAVFKKTFLDQAISSPTCLGIFFVGLGVMERKNLQDINSEVRLKLFDTWKVGLEFNWFLHDFGRVLRLYHGIIWLIVLNDIFQDWRRSTK